MISAKLRYRLKTHRQRVLAVYNRGPRTMRVYGELKRREDHLRWRRHHFGEEETQRWLLEAIKITRDPVATRYWGATYPKANLP